MKQTYVMQGGAANESIKNKLHAICENPAIDRIQSSTAYVTVSGVNLLVGALCGRALSGSAWVVGLDDCITQPGAIDSLTKLPNSSVRIATAEGEFRFHPKILYFKSSTQEALAVMLIGSANLTRHALTGNVETVVVLESETPADISELDHIWHQHWQYGRTPSAAEIKSYRLDYKRARKNRNVYKPKIRATIRPKKNKPRLVLDSDEAQIDPAVATTCWIECGYITAMGRELEFKAEQGLFFGLNPTGGPPVQLTFSVSDGSDINLKVKYQGNHMWRLQMTNEVPEVKAGLRPKLAGGKLGRSPFAAVFQKKANKIHLKFVRLTSRGFNELVVKTKEQGTLGQTSARSYGWL